jgi:hypothetical protein
MRFACWITKATNTLRIFNTCCFSMAPMVKRTRLNFALHVHCPSSHWVLNLTRNAYDIQIYKLVCWDGTTLPPYYLSKWHTAILHGRPLLFTDRPVSTDSVSRGWETFTPTRFQTLAGSKHMTKPSLILNAFVTANEIAAHILLWIQTSQLFSFLYFCNCYKFVNQTDPSGRRPTP